MVSLKDWKNLNSLSLKCLLNHFSENPKQVKKRPLKKWKIKNKENQWNDSLIRFKKILYISSLYSW